MDIFEAVKVKINGNNPALECHKMDDFVNPVLTQISICFDKNLEVIGCDKTHGGIYGRCHGLVEYPGTAERNHGGKSGNFIHIILNYLKRKAIFGMFHTWADFLLCYFNN